jgi:hypothetical protein
MRRGRGDASGEPVRVERFEAPRRREAIEAQPDELELEEWKPKHPRLWSLRR